jgi:phosphoglycolate phosphatase-like HAD superfamily hydrolase
LNQFPATAIEVIHSDHPRGVIQFAFFDFDGTLSLLRRGWQEQMSLLMVEQLMQIPNHKDEEELRAYVNELIALSTGKQTIYQMIRFAEEVQDRGGQALDPVEYKQLFQERMDRLVHQRIQSVRDGGYHPDEMMVRGSRDFLHFLRTKGIRCFLASGTDHFRVCEDVELLAIDYFFEEIHGAREDYWNFSKGQFVERILRENQLKGAELVVFGDGFSDIQESKQYGVLAVGLATDEVNRNGVDQWKRSRLIEAGADIIIPDFYPGDELANYLFKDD